MAAIMCANSYMIKAFGVMPATTLAHYKANLKALKGNTSLFGMSRELLNKASVYRSFGKVAYLGFTLFWSIRHDAHKDIYSVH